MAEQRPDRPPRKPGRPGPGNGAFRLRHGLLGWLLFIGLGVMLVMLVQQHRDTGVTLKLNQFFAALEKGQIAQITLEESEANGKFVLGTRIEAVGPGELVTFKVIFPANYLAAGGL